MASGRSEKRTRHFLVRFEMPFGIAAQQAAGGRKRAVMADAGEDIQHFALLLLRVADAIGREQRQFQFSRDCHGGLIARFFFAGEMALQFDVNILPAEHPAKLLHAFHGGFHSALRQSMRQRAFFAARQAD